MRTPFQPAKPELIHRATSKSEATDKESKGIVCHRCGKPGTGALGHSLSPGFNRDIFPPRGIQGKLWLIISSFWTCNVSMHCETTNTVEVEW